MIALYISLGILVIAVSVWLFLIAPKSNKEMNKYKNVKYAHRGLHGEIDGEYAAENSMTAFARAVKCGFGIELDVRLSSDGEVIVFHDGTLDRVAGVSGKPEERTAEELAGLSLSGTSDGVPTLREVLALVDGQVPLLIEIKEDGSDHAVTEALPALLKDYKGDYIIESFNPLTLGVVKKLMPQVPRGFLADKLTKNPDYKKIKYRIVQSFVLNFIARPSFIAMQKNRISMMPLPVIRAIFHTPCLAWTITSAEEEKCAYKAGFDSVIFEQYIPEKN